jgi:hypothetical protein
VVLTALHRLAMIPPTRSVFWARWLAIMAA